MNEKSSKQNNVFDSIHDNTIHSNSSRLVKYRTNTESFATLIGCGETDKFAHTKSLNQVFVKTKNANQTKARKTCTGH